MQDSYFYCECITK